MAVTAGQQSSQAALVPDGWQRLQREQGLVCGFGSRLAEPPAETLLLERQVHGIRVALLPDDASGLARNPGDGLRRLPCEADALVARRAGEVVGVRTADCVPLLLVAPRAGWAAAVHAGWRGSLAGIAVEAVQAAGNAGIPSEWIHAALGPSIGPCCYEVSTELGDEFAAAGFPVLRSSGSVKPHLDLREANRMLLLRCGLPEANVQITGPCTRCAKDRYHSFRADPGSGGRQVSWIGWSAS